MAHTLEMPCQWFETMILFSINKFSNMPSEKIPPAPNVLCGYHSLWVKEIVSPDLKVFNHARPTFPSALLTRTGQNHNAIHHFHTL